MDHPSSIPAFYILAFPRNDREPTIRILECRPKTSGGRMFGRIEPVSRIALVSEWVVFLSLRARTVPRLALESPSRRCGETRSTVIRLFFTTPSHSFLLSGTPRKDFECSVPSTSMGCDGTLCTWSSESLAFSEEGVARYDAEMIRRGSSVA